MILEFAQSVKLGKVFRSLYGSKYFNIFLGIARYSVNLFLECTKIIGGDDL
jgi:hypothetical protein